MTETVELKINIGTDIDQAVDTLCRGTATPGRLVYFLEDTTPGSEPSLPLLSAGVIVRLRSNPDDQDDSTIKLRPCRRSQLGKAWSKPWQDGRLRYRLEQDWASDRRCLAASCTAKSSSGRIVEIAHDQARIRDAFEEPQLAMLAECAGVRVFLDGLTTLGPIRATTWADTCVEGAAAERWTIDDEDFLELSMRCDDPATAMEQQVAFERSVRELVEIESSGKPKTRRVLEYFARRAANGQEDH